MKLVIIGASRGIGRELVVQALSAGHEVTACARHPQDIRPVHPRLRKLNGNILDPEAMRAAVAGQDAVVCAIGKKTPWEPPPDLFSRGTETLVAAMQSENVRRLVCVTGIGAGESRGHGGLLYDTLFRSVLLKRLYDDKERQEAIVRASGLEWTLVRPGFLTHGPRTREYAAITDLEGVTAGSISRADVAHFILQELTGSRYLHCAPLLTA